MIADDWIPNEELRPCDCCGGPLGPAFFVVDDAMVVVDEERATWPGGWPGEIYRVEPKSRCRRLHCQRCHL